MANISHPSCKNLESLKDFRSYADNLRQETGFIAQLLVECQVEICGAVWGTGNPDISGIGIIIGYVFELGLGFALAWAVFLTSVPKAVDGDNMIKTDSNGHRRRRGHLLSTLRNISHVALQSFFECALYFSLAAEIASYVMLVQRGYGVSTTGFGARDAQISLAITVLCILPLMYPIGLLPCSREQLAMKRRTSVATVAASVAAAELTNVPEHVADAEGPPLNQDEVRGDQMVALPQHEEASGDVGAADGEWPRGPLDESPSPTSPVDNTPPADTGSVIDTHRRPSDISTTRATNKNKATSSQELSRYNLQLLLFALLTGLIYPFPFVSQCIQNFAPSQIGEGNGDGRTTIITTEEWQNLTTVCFGDIDPFGAEEQQVLAILELIASVAVYVFLIWHVGIVAGSARLEARAKTIATAAVRDDEAGGRERGDGRESKEERGGENKKRGVMALIKVRTMGQKMLRTSKILQGLLLLVPVGLAVTILLLVFRLRSIQEAVAWRVGSYYAGNEWGFGQIVGVVIFAPVVTEVLFAGWNALLIGGGD